MRVLMIVLTLALAMAGDVALWGLGNRPAQVALPHEKLESLSYAPFRRGESPLTYDFPSVAQIRQDLALISTRARGIRTYTSLEGMEAVPRIAAKLGLTMTAGAWLGSVVSTNEEEVSALIAAANRYPKTIRRVIVGNEVLLRNDLTPAQLAGYIRQVRLAIKQPVSYADVWEYWLKHPEMAKDVDFITIHILPYWEDDPVGVKGAAAHILDVYRRVQKRFPGKPILIGETGWPTMGRSRGPAVPGRIEHARFMAAFLALARQQHLDYNIVEAFDQPWKSVLEGTVGANWGVFGANRKLKFPPGQGIEENPHWLDQGLIAACLGLLPALFWLRRRPHWRALAIFAALSQFLAACLVWAGASGFAASYTEAAEIWTGAKLVLETGFALAVLGTLARVLMSPDEAEPTRSLYDALARDGSLAAVGDGLHLALTLLAILLGGLLALDPRYRDFPVADFLVPTLGLLAFKAIELWQRRRASLAYGSLFEASARHGRTLPPSRLLRRAAPVLAALLLLAALTSLIREGWQNREALSWIVLLLLMAPPYLALLRRPARPADETPLELPIGADSELAGPN